MGNSHAGGDSGGFRIVSNTSIPPLVIRAESPPTASGIPIHKISNFQLIFISAPLNQSFYIL